MSGNMGRVQRPGPRPRLAKVNVNHRASSRLPTPRGQSRTPYQNSSLDQNPRSSLRPFAAAAAVVGFLSAPVRVADEMVASQMQSVARSKMRPTPRASFPALVETLVKKTAMIGMRWSLIRSWWWIRMRLAAGAIRASSARQADPRLSSSLRPAREALSGSVCRVVGIRRRERPGMVARVTLTWWTWQPPPRVLVGARAVAVGEGWLERGGQVLGRMTRRILGNLPPSRSVEGRAASRPHLLRPRAHRGRRSS